MKLAVSTLGMPGQPLREAIAIAASARCQGLELRLYPGTAVHLGMSAEEQAEARDAIAASGLSVVALAGYARVAAHGPDAPVVGELLAGLRLARALGARGLRVFPGGTDIAAAVRRVRAAVGDSPPGDDPDGGPGVRVLVETHDDLATGSGVARLLDAVALPGATGAVWDLLHPWRHGEQPHATLAALGTHLAYVQVKDAVSAADPAPVPLGTGAVPLARAGTVLRDAGYDGWASLEWESAWYPGVAPVAEVLPEALAWVSRYSATRARN
jgi:sugar phosphate isomerase/epimerase